jgi:hypothetical protein
LEPLRCDLSAEEALQESNDRGPIHTDYHEGYWEKNIVVRIRRFTITGNPFTVILPPHSLSTLSFATLSP